MRRIFVASLVLIPVLAHAQAGSSTGTKPSPAAATLVATSTPPAVPAAAPRTAVSTTPRAALHETVQERVEAIYLEPSGLGAGTLGYTLVNNPDEVTPKLVHVVPTNLQADKITAPVEVAVRMTVDALGVPQNLTVEKSAGAELDKKTLEAVRQFRFEPASVNRRNVESTVTVDIKVEKK